MMPARTAPKEWVLPLAAPQLCMAGRSAKSASSSPHPRCCEGKEEAQAESSWRDELRQKWDPSPMTKQSYKPARTPLPRCHCIGLRGWREKEIGAKNPGSIEECLIIYQICLPRYRRGYL